MYKNFFKRTIDFILSLIGLICVSPILAIFTLLLAIANQGKPFFLQKRPGKNEKIFSIIKLKTMNDVKDETGSLLSDEKRLTKIGKLVRKTSIDELPQLINVVKGDMSLIGPRPLLPEYLPLYNKEQKKRHNIRPGITGLAQVSGRNAISWQEKFKYDIYYVENLSFLLDLQIIFKTIKKVFVSEGISQKGEATMEKFNGKN